MKTLPINITNGIANNSKKCYAICLNGYYSNLYFSSVNLPLYHNGSEVNVDTFHFPHAYKNSFSTLDYFLNVNKLLNKCTNVNFVFNILNFDRFDLELEGNISTGSILSFFFFYISPLDEYFDLSNALLVSQLEVESINKNDYSFISIKCRFLDLLKSRIIPDNLLTSDLFPNAPLRNKTASLPILYGNFTGTNTKYDINNVAPAICVDEYSKIYYLAKHSIYSNSVYGFLDSNFILPISQITSTLTYSQANANIKIPNVLTIELNIQPKSKGSQLNSSYLTSFVNAVDRNTSSYVTVTSATNFYLFINSIRLIEKYIILSGGSPIIRLFFKFGTVVNGGSGYAGRVKYYYNSTWYDLGAGYNITAAMSNSEQYFTFTLTLPTVDNILSQAEFGFSVEAGGSIQLINFFINIQLVI